MKREAAVVVFIIRSIHLCGWIIISKEYYISLFYLHSHQYFQEPRMEALYYTLQPYMVRAIEHY